MRRPALPWAFGQISGLSLGDAADVCFGEHFVDLIKCGQFSRLAQESVERPVLARRRSGSAVWLQATAANVKFLRRRQQAGDPWRLGL